MRSSTTSTMTHQMPYYRDQDGPEKSEAFVGNGTTNGGARRRVGADTHEVRLLSSATPFVSTIFGVGTIRSVSHSV